MIGTGLFRAECAVLVNCFKHYPKRALQYYHYTNGKSKANIVNGRVLDFCLSNTRDFLDKNEGTAILEPYYHACGRLYETGRLIKNSFCWQGVLLRES